MPQDTQEELTPDNTQVQADEAVVIGGAALGAEEVKNLETERQSHEQRWEAEAARVNDDRSLLQRVRGKGEVDSTDVMRKEADRDNEKFDRMPERNRPGSAYLELPPDKVESLQELMADLRREIEVLDEAKRIALSKQDNLYRAPELTDAQYRSGEQRFALFMLRKLAQDGRVNFWDASIDIKDQLLNGGHFFEQDQKDYLDACDRLQHDLGIDYQVVPPAEASTDRNISPTGANEESGSSVPVLEYEVEDIRRPGKRTEQVGLPGTQEEAENTAFNHVIQQEWSPDAIYQVVTGARIKLPDGQTVPWQDYTAPAMQRGQSKPEA